MVPVHQQTGELQCPKFAASIALESFNQFLKYEIRFTALRKLAKKKEEENGKRKKEKMTKTIRITSTELKELGQSAKLIYALIKIY
jgi:hypothetical protein